MHFLKAHKSRVLLPAVIYIFTCIIIDYLGYSKGVIYVNNKTSQYMNSTEVM